VVYVDNDPIVLAHSHMLLDSTPQGARAYVDGDLRDPDVIFEHASATLDLSQPVAILLVAILHLTPDDQDPYGIVARLLDGVSSGSHLVVSHLASDIAADEMADLARSAPKEAKYTFAMRTRPEVTRFFDGLELVEPGVVPVREWRPDGSAQPGGDDRVTAMYGAVGRKP
jgi:S-adenosyl methyltransferase